jgi:predicted naringenin-chalcone synthase
LAVGRALPRHYATQEQLIAELRRLWSRRHFNLARLEELHRAVQVEGRHLALPIERYRELDTFGKANAAWIDAATELGTEAVRSALARARAFRRYAWWARSLVEIAAHPAARRRIVRSLARHPRTFARLTRWAVG